MIIRNQLITPRRGNEQIAWGNAPGNRQHDKRPVRAKALLFLCFCPCRAWIMLITHPGRCPALWACWPFRPLSDTNGWLFHIISETTILISIL